jgi:hypothetical protein
MRTNCLLGLLLVAAAVSGQTQVSYTSQIQSSTKPTRLGITLPSTCNAGDLFLKTDAPAGANLYACLTGGNVWTLEGNSIGAGGTVTIASGGSVIGTEPVNSFNAGLGVIQTFTDTGTQVNIGTAIDPAIVPTHTQLQAGTDLYCSSFGTTMQDYACNIVPIPTSYVQGMVLHWTPDVATAGGAATLAVSGLAAVPVKLEDGSTDPSVADIQAGRMKLLWFDGTSFRMFSSAGRVASGIPRPACAAAFAGRIWYTAGGTGVKDQVAVCVKDATDTYQWGDIY